MESEKSARQGPAGPGIADSAQADESRPGRGGDTSACGRSRAPEGRRAGGPRSAGQASDAGGELDPAAWRAWLSGGSAREVLARIVQDDPLGVREHVAHALQEGAYLLDGQRVALRCFALVARHALRYRGRPALAEWVALQAREAVAAILREDGEAERRPGAPGHEPGREHGEAFLALARPLGLEVESLGRACLAFNRLPHADRTAFFALVIAGNSLDQLARESGEGATEIARRARRALDAVLQAAAPAGPAEEANRGSVPGPSSSVAAANPSTPSQPKSTPAARPAEPQASGRKPRES